MDIIIVVLLVGIWLTAAQIAAAIDAADRNAARRAQYTHDMARLREDEWRGWSTPPRDHRPCNYGDPVPGVPGAVYEPYGFTEAGEPYGLKDPYPQLDFWGNTPDETPCR